MKKCMSCLLCISATLLLVCAAGAENEKVKGKRSDIQQMDKPAYYEPYNTPANNRHKNNYDSGWAVITKKARDKKNNKE